MSKTPKIKLPDPDTPEGRWRMNLPVFPGAWKYENEPRVLFKVSLLRSPIEGARYGQTVIVGIPESLVGNIKLEKKWIKYECGGEMVKIEMYRLASMSKIKGKNILPKGLTS